MLRGTAKSLGIIFICVTDWQRVHINSIKNGQDAKTFYVEDKNFSFTLTNSFVDLHRDILSIETLLSLSSHTNVLFLWGTLL